MGFLSKEERESNEQNREAGVSTEPGHSVMDQRQAEGASHEGVQNNETQVSNYELKETDEVHNHDEVNVDHEALNDSPDELDQEPKQVEENKVLFYPLKDFTARVNQQDFLFRKGVQTEVTEDVANMLAEDDTRGYIKE